jgi:hypothetical protein
VPERHAQRQILQAHVERGTERTLEIGVLDHRRPVGGTAGVIVGAERWKGSRAEVAGARRQAASPSKIRFAPGSSAGEDAW